MELSTDYEQEQATLKARAAELQAELGQAQEAAVNVEKFMAVVRKYTSFEEYMDAHGGATAPIEDHSEEV